MPELASNNETAEQLKQAQSLLAKAKVARDEKGNSNGGGGNKVEVEDVGAIKKSEAEFKTNIQKGIKSKKTKTVSRRETPQHTVGIKGDAITVKISLPSLTSMAGVELDVSSLGLKLKHDQYLLRCKFPQAIDEDSVKAKFSKKKQSLTIKCTASK